MLVRDGTRTQRRSTARLLAFSFAQLQLPWLAPAQLRWHASQAHSSPSTIPTAHRRCQSLFEQPTIAQSRSLATATDQHAPRYSGYYPPPGYTRAFRNTRQDKNIPWDSWRQSSEQLSSLRPHEGPILINTSTQRPPQTVRVAHGVEGTAINLLQHLHTSLQIGRSNRAEKIITRLSELCSPDSAELLHAHTIYLEDCQRRLASLDEGADARAYLKAMQRWFEVQVRNKGVDVDAKILVVMIKASIRALSGSQRTRSVRRYTELAQQLGEEQCYDALESEDYDDKEFAILCRIVDDRNASIATPITQAETESRNAKPHEHRQQGDFLPVEQIPEVLPTSQKGEGLSNIKRTLNDFIVNPSLSANTPKDQRREQAIKRQRILEETSVVVAVDRWRKADEELRKIGIHTAMQSRPLIALMWQWYSALLPALQAELDACKESASNPAKVNHDRHYYGPYLEVIPLEKIAAITILETLARMNSGKNFHSKSYEHEVKLSQLSLGLAKAIEQECQSHLSQARHKGLKNSSASRHNSKQRGTAKSSNKNMSRLEQQRQTLLAQLEWPLDAKVVLGSFLVSKLIETAQLPVTREHPRTLENITQMQPAFLHRHKFDKGKRTGLICSNPALVEKVESEPLGGLLAKRMPMVVEPKPWKGWSEGGYMHYANPILRLPLGDKSGKDYFMAANKKGDISQIYAGLTALGQVPWKIHHGVFKVQLEAWNSGEAIANLAPLNPELDVPAEPATSETDARKKWLLEMREIENQRAGLHSKRCFQNFQLEIARTMINETLYFPHNMDFRGRAYPIPPYLNHMGADNVRGLLVFADGKELGPKGLRWLKIHLATVAGHDKASMTERIAFTMSHLDDIYDSVRNPLSGRRWWLKAEDAWQTLAACFELTEALDSPDPTRFVSHLPVQQDGTCNGLQHYAALGGDEAGAAQVNLQPGDRPADVYSAVARAVEEQVHHDALAGNAIAQKLDGRITRKCVKQPVMTNVYGVTWYGAKEQVRRQLEVLFPEVRKTGAVNIGNMSQYVATKIFKSLGEMFAGAQAIQNWLGVCADRISTCLTPQQIGELAHASKIQSSNETHDAADGKVKAKKAPSKRSKKQKGEKETLQVATSTAWVQQQTGTALSTLSQRRTAKLLFKSTVVWTTPLRLPVVQPYRSAESRTIKTNLQRIQISDPQVWHPVSKRKQLQAFPPNFIHSLDATHMLLTALRCKELGMTFASIHDSFWTHACDVDKLSTVIRESFIEMHKENVIGRLREEFQTRYKGSMHLATVVALSPVGEKITAWRKERKHDPSSELSMEAERLRLLQSEDAADRAKGEAMVTPGSILSTEGNEASLAPPPEIAQHQLGTILHRSDDESTDVEAKDTDAMAKQSEGEEVPNPVEAAGIESNTADSGNSEKEPVLGPRGQPKKIPQRKIFVWQPLTFPEVPPRGSFDVRKIRDSAYFFH